VDAKRTLTIVEAPNVLVLHLKRFEGTMGKITRHVEFAERLSLLEFLSPESPEREAMAAARQAALDGAQQARAKAKAEAEAAAAAAAREAAAREAREAAAAARRRTGRGGLPWRGGSRGLLGPPPHPPPPRLGLDDGATANGIPAGSPALANGLRSPAQSSGPGAAASPAAPDGANRAAGQMEEQERAADEAAAAAAEAAASPEYGLCGVLVHQGFAASQGHYYAFVKDGQGLSLTDPSHEHA